MDLFTIFVSGIIMLLLDFVYLSSVTKAYSEQIAKIQRTAMNIKLEGAALCYMFLIFGLYYFILKENKSPFDAFLLGLVIYGVYETTSYALFKKWSLHLVAIDTLWGGVLFALTTIFTYELVKFM
jgi:uncharacterized membrane protein